MIFKHFVDVLGELLATLLVQRWDGNTNQPAVVGWIEAKVGCAYGFFHRPDHRYVVGLYGDQSRFGSCELANLVDRCRNTVVVDLNIVEDRNRCAACSDRAEFLAKIL